MVRALHQMGFEVIRIKGSHYFLRHLDGRCTVVPVHAGEMLGIGLVGKISKDADVSAEDLLL
jgi:predicted RNA binding protein YcfA (HicA-like mRNA interferase family)